MAEVIRTIGTGGDYSSIGAWEADLDTATYTGHDAIGELLDSAYYERVSINSTNPASITLRPAAGMEHTGTAGSGVRVWHDGGSFFGVINCLTSKPIAIRGIEVDGANAANHRVIRLASSGYVHIDRCILHRAQYAVQNNSSTSDCDVTNCIIYNVDFGVTGNSVETWRVFNSTLIKDPDTDAANAGGGLRYVQANNCIVMHFGGSSGWQDILDAKAGSSHNITSDTSASGTGSLTNQVASDYFVNLLAGSVDLHLISTAPAIDAGTTLAAPTGVDIDIDGEARTGTWDIGADEVVAASGSIANIFNSGILSSGIIRGLL